jgi:hypothetical protein
MLLVETIALYDVNVAMIITIVVLNLVIFILYQVSERYS